MVQLENQEKKEREESMVQLDSWDWQDLKARQEQKGKMDHQGEMDSQENQETLDKRVTMGYWDVEVIITLLKI